MATGGNESDRVERLLALLSIQQPKTQREKIVQLNVAGFTQHRNRRSSPDDFRGRESSPVRSQKKQEEEQEEALTLLPVMPKAVADFRNFAFDSSRIGASGRDVGAKVYSKLYAIENLIRVVVHSVLTAQLGQNWWIIAADPNLQREVSWRRASYGNRPWHSTPGKHEVYYVYLSDLTKIMTTNSAQFVPHIPDVDQWTARLEQIRLPRNIVGHMNWPTKIDRKENRGLPR